MRSFRSEAYRERLFLTLPGTMSNVEPASKRPRYHEIVTDDEIFSHGREVLECEVCSAYFLSQTNLDSHLKSHRLQKDYHCRTCARQYSSLSSLKLHMRSSHTEPRENRPIQHGGGTVNELARQVNVYTSPVIFF